MRCDTADGVYVQQARGTLKAAFACHDGQGGEQGGVEHAADSTLAILNLD
jgi:hypothetical protein